MCQYRQNYPTTLREPEEYLSNGWRVHAILYAYRLKDREMAVEKLMQGTPK
jgi:hypothetical protein